MLREAILANVREEIREEVAYAIDLAETTEPTSELLEALKVAVQLATEIQSGGATPLGAARLIADISAAAIAKAEGRE